MTDADETEMYLTSHIKKVSTLIGNKARNTKRLEIESIPASFNRDRKVKALQKTELMYSSILFLANIVIYVSFALLLRDGSTAFFGQVMDYSFSPTKTITLQEDVWDYLSTDLLKKFPDDISNNATIILEESVGILGHVELRLYRKREASCKYDFIPGIKCISSELEDEPFGPKNISTFKRTTSFFGLLDSYSGSHNSIYLPRTKQEALVVINQLKDYPWIDQQTDLVLVFINAYVPNALLFGQYVTVLEKTRSGMWMASKSFSTFVIPNNGIFATFALYLFFFLIYQFNYFRKFLSELFGATSCVPTFVKYFLTVGWELVNSFYILTEMIIVSLMIVYFVKVYEFIDTLNVGDLNFDYSVMDPLFTLSIALFIVLSAGLCLMILKTMHYFEINSYTSITFNTILMAFPHIIALLVVSLTVWISFAVTGTLLFAPHALEFRQIMISFLSTWDMLTGSLGIQTFMTFTPVLGPLYYILFTVVMTFILLNMFVGLVTEFYNENMKQRESHSMGGKHMSFPDKLRKGFRKCKHYMLEEENTLTIEEAVNLLAYKTYSKLSMDAFQGELIGFGVPEQDDYEIPYTQYLEKRRMRDLSGLETGDILTLWNLIEDKFDRMEAEQKKRKKNTKIEKRKRQKKDLKDSNESIIVD